MASDITSLDEDDVSDEDFEMPDDQIEEEEEDDEGTDDDNQQKQSHLSRKKVDKPDPMDEQGMAKQIDFFTYI